MNKAEIRKILEIAIPSTIAYIAHIGYNVSDNIMVGRFLGTESLAIAGIAGSIYFIFLLLGWGSTGIIAALVSEATTKNDNAIVTRVLQNSLLFSFIVGVTISLLLFFFSGKLVLIFNEQAQLDERIIKYLKILSFAPMAAMTFFALERFSEGINKAKYAMFTVLITNILNVCLNYSFLTGSFGMPNLGINSTAVATTIANISEAIILFTFLKKDRIAKQFMHFKLKYLSLDKLKLIALVGLPGGLFAFSESAAFNVAGFIASNVSVNDVAAHQIIYWTISTFLTPIFGFTVAATARIAYNVAKNEHKLAFQIGAYLLIATVMYMLVAMSVLLIFKDNILWFVIKDDAYGRITFELVATTLFIIFFIEIIDAVQFMGGGILRGYKDVKLPLVFAIFSYWGLCIPLGYFFAINQGMGVYGIWLGIGIGLCFQSFFIVTRFITKFKPSKILKQIKA